MKFEEIVTSLGDFGPYQKTIYFLLCLTSIPHAFQTLGILFTMGNQDHRCSIPDLPNDTFNVQGAWHSALISDWIPVGEDGHYSPCQIHVLDRVSQQLTNETTTCSRFVYDTSNYESTITSDVNLVCDRKSLKTYANMIYMAGMLAGSILIGTISDSFGRKTSLMICIVGIFVASLVIAFVQSYVAFVVLRFFTAVCSMGLFMTAFVIGMEIVGPETRKLAGIIIEIFWVIGLLFNVLFAYVIRNWMELQIATAVPTVLLLSYAFIIPESPRWLIRKGRYEEASKIIQQAAKFNKVNLGDDLLNMEKVENDGPTAKIWQMFTVKVLLIRTLVLVYGWCACSLVYFGLSLNVAALSGDIYMNTVLFAIVEGMAYTACFFLLDRAGRKAMMVVSQLLAGVSCLATMFPVIYGAQGLGWLTVALSMVGKFASSITFGVVFVYSAEVFPTTTRNLGIGICSFSARIGGILSPYIADLGNVVGGDMGVAIPLVIFGGASLLAGLLTLLLPDTTNRILPESIQDAVEFGRSPDKTKKTNTTKTIPEDPKGSYVLLNGKDANNTLCSENVKDVATRI